MVDTNTEDFFLKFSLEFTNIEREKERDLAALASLIAIEI